MNSDDMKKTIRNIKQNYKKLEEGIVNDLYFMWNHGGTIGRHREEIWGEMFRNIVPKKFVIEQSVFIIDSDGNVSREVDLAIFDETYTPYVFQYNSLKFIPVEAVAVVIECKSKSMGRNQLEEWAKSIRALKSSSRAIVRMWNKVVCEEEKNDRMTQTQTRPLRILCCLNERGAEASPEKEKNFDVVIRANDSGKYLEIEWDREKKNLYDWNVALNHADTENTGKRYENEKDLEKRELSNYTISLDGGRTGLMTFQFQLNQILMLINNPMPFPHLAYVHMFNQYGQDGRDAE